MSVCLCARRFCCASNNKIVMIYADAGWIRYIISGHNKYCKARAAELRERHLTRQYNCRPYNISLVVCNCYSLRSMETKGKYLDRMTWPEAEKALETTTVIIVPVGARTKEHGYHLQLNNDYLTAEYMTKAILDRCDNVLAVPTVQYGYYPAFVNFPGSINISRAVFRDMIVDICASMHRHKPSLRFYIQNGGISTNYSLEPARKILAEKGIIMEFTDLFVAGISLSDWLYFCYCGVIRQRGNRKARDARVRDSR
jgi:hypothetical protein